MDDRCTQAAVPRFERMGLCVTEDWFALSHFRPLIAALRSVSRHTTVITRVSKHRDELVSLGVDVVHFEWGRRSLGIVEQLGTARRLAKIAREQRIEALHLVAMKPVVIGSLAAMLLPGRPLAFHFTGLGHLFIRHTIPIRIARGLSIGAVRLAMLGRSWVAFAENTEDVADLSRAGLRTDAAVIVPGAGIDPDEYMPPSSRSAGPVIVTCLARMIRSKGVDVLVRAHRVLRARGLDVELHLFGDIDEGNPETLDQSTLRQITRGEGVVWHGHTLDSACAWQACDIAVLASRSREGMPRSVLEAASCGRPLVVSDVPGCREIVRDGVEGFVVAPGDPEALADALARLAQSPALRERLGRAARERVVSGFTTAHVTRAIIGGYRELSMRAW